MRISIDLDGTLWQHMGFFRALMLAMQAQGHQVGILTGHGVEIREADIALMIARGFPRPDFFLGKEIEEDKARNGGYFKARMILEHRIDVHFDDHDFGNPHSEQILLDYGLRNRLMRAYHSEPHSVHSE